MSVYFMEETETTPAEETPCTKAKEEAEKDIKEEGKEEEKPEETKTPSQALKEENDSLEKEMIRAQKLRNEKLLAGTSGGHIESKPKEETPKEYKERIDKEISEGKHDD